MKICIIYHSETGNTRRIAQHLESSLGAHLIEVTDKATYLPLTKFLAQCKKAHGEDKTTIEPEAIDVSGCDLLVFGSPVWAFRPTPAVHTAIATLKGCEGKKAIAFATHGGRPGKTEETFRRWIESREMRYVGFADIAMKDIENEMKARELVSLIKKAGTL
jgi:flavodoxin